MKPFDLEAAKRGEPICTRDGRPAVFAGYNPTILASNALAAWVGDELYSFYRDGSHVLTESSLDLIMATKKRTVWVNFYLGTAAAYHVTKDKADRFAELSGRIGGKAYPVEIDE